MNKKEAEKLKMKGNLAYSVSDYGQAIELYTKAIELDGRNHILFSNRSEAYLKIRDYAKALEDGERTIKLKHDWPKGYMRKALALDAMGRWLEAGDTYEMGLRHDPDNEILRKARYKVMRKMSNPGVLVKGMDSRVKKDSPFARKDLMDRLKMNVKTREYLKDAVYSKLLERVIKNPSDLNLIISDQRMVMTLGILMNEKEDEVEEDDVEIEHQSEDSKQRVHDLTSNMEILQKLKSEDGSKSGGKESRLILSDYLKDELTTKGEMILSHQSMRGNRTKESNVESVCVEDTSESKTSDVNVQNQVSTKVIIKKEIVKGSKKTGGKKNVCDSETKSGSDNRSAKTAQLVASLKERMERLEEDHASTIGIKDELSQFLLSAAEANGSKRVIDIRGSGDDNLKEISMLEKVRGDKAYGNGDYVKALDHYERGALVCPNDVSFYTNIAACLYEQGEYRRCITQCETAIQIGQQIKSESHLMAKAFVRIGQAYGRLENWRAAKTYFNKSQSLHYLSEVDALIKEAETSLKSEIGRKHEDDNHWRAVESSDRGNALYKIKKYRDALPDYTDAINYEPNQPMHYYNRANCYYRIKNYTNALRDYTSCLERNPKFLDALVRKGEIHLEQRDLDKALITFEKALLIDRNCLPALEGFYSCIKDDNPEATARKALHDKEIQRMILDPETIVALCEMTQDPNKLFEHLTKPKISSALGKLLSVGLAEFKYED